MNDDKSPPSFAGPEPLQLPKTTAPPSYPGVAENPSGVRQAVATVASDMVKMKRASRMKMYGAIGTVLLTLVGGGKAGTALAQKGETIETKQARLEERQKSTDKAVETLVVRVDAGEKARVHDALKLERVEALLELELDMHGVPRSKRPAPVPEPKDAPEGGTP